MKLTPSRTFSRDISTLFRAGTLGGLTDGQLLERFATRVGEGAELAFSALVERHGPMVLRVCRSILRDDHEALDAFQATFLVLARKGNSLWVRDSIGPWLHRVAYPAAGQARAQAERRQALERRAVEAAGCRASREDRDDRAAALHEELDHLPERYRVPIVLCDLEGRTCEEAAQHLGHPVGTVKSWRARGRESLRTRLLRRGVAPAIGVLGNILTVGEAATLVPGALVESTAAAAMASVGGRAAFGAVPASIVLLSEKALGSMLIARLGTACVGTLMLAGAFVTGGFAFQRVGTDTSNATGLTFELAEKDRPGSAQAKAAAPQEVGRPEGDEAPGQSEPKASPRLEMIEGEIASASSDLKRAGDRLDEAKQLFVKGDASPARMIAAELEVNRAKFALEHALAKKKVLEKYRGREPVVRRNQEEYNRLRDEIYAKAAEKASAQAQFEAVEAINRLESKKAEAETAAAAALVDLRQAEVAEIKLRWVRVIQDEPFPADRTDVDLLKFQVKTKRIGLRYEQARLEKVKTEMALDALRRERTPGSVSGENSKKLEEEVAAAATLCDRKRAEISELELRLGHPK